MAADHGGPIVSWRSPPRSCSARWSVGAAATTVPTPRPRRRRTTTGTTTTADVKTVDMRKAGAKEIKLDGDWLVGTDDAVWVMLGTEFAPARPREREEDRRRQGPGRAVPRGRVCVRGAVLGHLLRRQGDGPDRSREARGHRRGPPADHGSLQPGGHDRRRRGSDLGGHRRQGLRGLRPGRPGPADPRRRPTRSTSIRAPSRSRSATGSSG